LNPKSTELSASSGTTSRTGAEYTHGKHDRGQRNKVSLKEQNQFLGAVNAV